MAQKQIKQLNAATEILEDDLLILQQAADDDTLKITKNNFLGGGWNKLNETPDSVTNNGNGSHTLTFNSVDMSDILSEGMRLRTTRGTAAPDQCADLESSSSQYFSKSSPSGITFTDDFTCMAWIKLESYPAVQMIASRYNGSSGWWFSVEADGRVQAIGFNGSAANFRGGRTYQSLPLNKWVHVAITTNMSAQDYNIYINGVLVPNENRTGGTNPTSLVQAGDLQVGALNGSTQPFDGKVAQVAVFDALLTEANIREYMSRPLTGSETNCVAAFSLDNDITDLTSNNNDLTAQNSAVATDADSPFGNGGVSTTLDYGIVTKIDYSTNTDVVVQTPEGCTIDATNSISAVSYSTASSPFGFPRDAGKWEIETQNRNNATQSSPTDNVYYNIGELQLNVPIGAWSLEYMVSFATDENNDASFTGRVSLSTSSSAVSTNDLSSYHVTVINGATNGDTTHPHYRNKSVNLESSTPYYLIATTTSGVDLIEFRGDIATTIIRARCAYL